MTAFALIDGRETPCVVGPSPDYDPTVVEVRRYCPGCGGSGRVFYSLGESAGLEEDDCSSCGGLGLGAPAFVAKGDVR